MILRTLRMLLAAVALIVAVYVAGTGATHYLGAEQAGAVPMERLERRGSPAERSAARAVWDQLATDPWTSDVEWSARREVSRSGDTIRFRIYRREDSGARGRILRPRPYVSGHAEYVVPERRLHGPAIGIE